MGSLTIPLLRLSELHSKLVEVVLRPFLGAAGLKAVREELEKALIRWGIVKIMVPFGSPKLGPVLGPVL